MSSSSRLVLEVRSHIIMSSNFTLLLEFLYAFSAKKKLKTWFVCANIFLQIAVINFLYIYRIFLQTSNSDLFFLVLKISCCPDFEDGKWK